MYVCMCVCTRMCACVRMCMHVVCMCVCVNVLGGDRKKASKSNRTQNKYISYNVSQNILQ